jgi:hypothetical protein
VWWCTPVIPAFGRLRQEDHKLKFSLGYIAKPRLTGFLEIKSTDFISVEIKQSIPHLNTTLFRKN